jgi:putative isomerase
MTIVPACRHCGFSDKLLGGSIAMSLYQDLQKKIAHGWNTWNVRSVTSHVFLPEGFALNLALKEYKAGRYLKEALIGRLQGDPGHEYRGGEHVEVITPGPHAYDGSYTGLRLAWRGIELTVQTATAGDDLVILVTPLTNQK